MPPPSVYQRRRAPTSDELTQIPWLHLLSPAERARITPKLVVSDPLPGDYVCRVGKPATYWFGVIEGLLKMSTDSASGRSITFTGVPPGGWFGEGTAIKRESYRYNIMALRHSVVAGLPLDTFHWLLDNSIGFNRFVMNQLNERLGQFIEAREIDRSNDPDVRVARNLATPSTPRSTLAWARCCASPSKSWLTWWACHASASMWRSTPCKSKAPFALNTAACACSTWPLCAPLAHPHKPTGYTCRLYDTRRHRPDSTQQTHGRTWPVLSPRGRCLD